MTEHQRTTGRALVVIPTYNERENIEKVVSRVRRATPEVAVLIVDDNSPDGTGEIADGLTADPSVHVLHRAGKEGLGAAYLAGFRWAFEHEYDVVIEMDADGSHQPEELDRLLDALERADVVQGSRWVRGGQVVNWPFSRRLISRGGSLYTRVLLRIPIKDITGGYRAYRASALRKMDLHDVESAGYCFQIDLLRRAHRRGLSIREVPITFIERTLGTSKMSRGIVVEAMLRVTAWAAADLFSRGGSRAAADSAAEGRRETR